MTLSTDAKLLHDLVNDLDADHLEDDDDRNFLCLEIVGEAIKNLRTIHQRLGDQIGERMPRKRLTVIGQGTYTRSPRREGSTKCKDEHGLWRYVLDTRLVDPETGEILPQHEVIRRVYGSESRETGEVRLTGASPTKVEAVGIDPEDFFEKAPIVGWSIRVDR